MFFPSTLHISGTNQYLLWSTLCSDNKFSAISNKTKRGSPQLKTSHKAVHILTGTELTDMIQNINHSSLTHTHTYLKEFNTGPKVK